MAITKNKTFRLFIVFLYVVLCVAFAFPAKPIKVQAAQMTAPEITAIKAGEESLTVSYYDPNESNDDSSYIVSWAEISKEKVTSVVSSPTDDDSSYTITGLKPTSSYAVVVTAVEGNNSVSSKAMSAQPLDKDLSTAASINLAPTGGNNNVSEPVAANDNISICACLGTQCFLECVCSGCNALGCKGAGNKKVTTNSNSIGSGAETGSNAISNSAASSNIGTYAVKVCGCTTCPNDACVCSGCSQPGCKGAASIIPAQSTNNIPAAKECGCLNCTGPTCVCIGCRQPGCKDAASNIPAQSTTTPPVAKECGCLNCTGPTCACLGCSQPGCKGPKQLSPVAMCGCKGCEGGCDCSGCSGEKTCNGGNCICKVKKTCQSCSQTTCICDERGQPFAVDGRILSSDKTGDNSSWIEIARYKNYSLIVRTKHLAINYGSGAEYTSYSSTGSNNYDSSIARAKINNWFNRSAVNADNLSQSAKLRNYSVKNNAASKLGSGTESTAGANDSFSLPKGELCPNGTDIAFALSYSEVANFLSDYYQYGGGVSVESPQEAKRNFQKISIPSDPNHRTNMVWLRSPGNGPDRASILTSTGRVFQSYVNGYNDEYAYVFPALWVDSAIFD